VTFLFTDIEDSTPLLERVGMDVYEALLADHHRIIRAAVAAHGGVEVDTQGDGFFIAFAYATDAVCAAGDAQAAVGATTWPEGVELRVRMGVHSGDVRVVDDDYVGLPVHEAARVSAAAYGGQVLVSQRARDLLDEAALCGGELVDVGPHRLRGIAKPLRLYRLKHPDLGDDARPPRTQRAAQHNLPVSTNSFVGRGRELEQVAEALAETRILTLTGVGGVGKTRLALAAGHAAVASYPDGVWLIELASVGDAESLPRAVAGALGVEPGQGMTIEASLIDSVADKTLLLVLDNCEHLLEPVAALVENITRTCPDVSILATSREGLSCEGERMLMIPSLEAPQPGEANVDYPSVVLFVDRARAVRSDFVLTDDNTTAVADICRRLNGIPLALELAAARMRTMRPEDIAGRLGEIFRVLTGGRRTAVERHRTLRAAIDWSYELLRDAERLVFDRSSVFAGGFTLEAACMICAGGPVAADDVEEIIEGLVDKSMVVCDPTRHDVRYSVLETLRQYGADRLEERAETDEVRRRHAEYFTDFSVRVDEGLRGPDESRWFDDLARELDNVRAAFTWALDAGEMKIAVRICTATSVLFGNRWNEQACVWADQLVDVPAAVADPSYSLVLSVVATGMWQRGDMEAAAEVAQQAHELAHDVFSRAVAVGVLGSVAIFRGRPEEASRRFEDAVRLIAELGDAYQQAILCGAGAITYSYEGDHARARELADEHMRLNEKVDNPSCRADALYSMAEVIMHEDPDRAIELAREAAAIARSGKNSFAEGVALVTVTSLLGRHGDPAAALESFSEVIERWREMGNWAQQWNTIRNLIELFARIERDEAAVILDGAAEASGKAPPVYGPHGDRFNGVIRSLEARLGSVAFAALRARGEELDGPNAVAFAQAEIETALRARERAAIAS
jgi:predicted ATPase/class 3 adenylate cyclase